MTIDKLNERFDDEEESGEESKEGTHSDNRGKRIRIDLNTSAGTFGQLGGVASARYESHLVEMCPCEDRKDILVVDDNMFNIMTL